MGGNEERQTGMGLAIGSRIGKYEIRQQLSAGAGPMVYKCYDKLLDRHVAIKHMLARPTEAPNFLAKCRKEAQILARLGTEQPAIVAIHELIEDQTGLFIVMDFAEGYSLETVLNGTDGPVEAKATLQVLWRLAAGLHAVHSAGIIHRGIMPRRIIIGDGLKVNITGFGAAEAAAVQRPMLPGTTKYVAPETLEGGKLDGRADIYSLGLVAYEMLAGRPRFNEIFAEVIGDGEGEPLRWVKWHGNVELAAPPLHEVNPQVPRALSDIVAKMTAKAADNRFESMEALGRAIKQGFSRRAWVPGPEGQAGRRIGAPGRPAGPGQASSVATPGEQVPWDLSGEGLDITPVGPPRRRRFGMALPLRVKLILAAVAVIGILAIGVAVGTQARRSRNQMDALLSEAFSKAADDYRKGDWEAASEEFADLAGRWPHSSQGIKASVMVHLAQAHDAVAKGDWRQAQDDENLAAARTQKVQADYGYLRKWAGEVNQEISTFAQDRAQAQMFAEVVAKARAAADAGNYQEARDIVNRQISSVERTRQQEDRQTELLRELDRREFVGRAESYLSQGQELVKQAKFAEAATAYGEVRTMLDSPGSAMLPDAEKESVSTRLSVAVQQAAAEQAYQEALTAAAEAAARADKQAELGALETAVQVKPSAADTLQRIVRLRSTMAVDEGRRLLDLGQVDKAQAKFEEALKADPGNAEADAELKKTLERTKWQETVNLAAAAFDAGNLSEALEKYQQAGKIRSDAGIDAKIAECRFGVRLAEADALRDEKKYDQALEAYQSARQIKPEASATIDGRISEVHVRQKYSDEMDKGDAAFLNQQWAEALRRFRNAKAVRQTDEVDQRIVATRYTESLTKGVSAMDRGDLPSAKGHFNIAKRHMDTEQVNELIKQVEKKLKQQQGE